MDLCIRGIHVGLVSDNNSEVATIEGRDAREEDEEGGRFQAYHSIVMSRNLRQAVCRVTNREGGGGLLLGDICTKTGRMEGESVAFNCYKHWVQLLLCKPRRRPVTLPS